MRKTNFGLTFFLLISILLIAGCTSEKGQNFKGISRNKSGAEEWARKGISYLNKQDYDNAVVAFTRALELNPQDAPTYYNRGYAWKMKGDLPRALTDMKKALVLVPNDRQIQVSISILEELIAVDKGKEYFKKRMNK